MAYQQSVSDEDDMWASIEEERRRRDATIRTSTPDVASRTAANQRRSPTTTKANYPLAKRGHGPDSPVTRAVAEGQARRKAREKKRGHRGIGFHTLGEVTRSAARVPGKATRGIGRVAGAIAEPVADVLEFEARGISKFTRPIVRSGLLVADGTLEIIDGMARDYARQIQEHGVVEGILTGGDPFRVAKEQPPSVSIAVDKLARGEHVDLGHGWLAGGEVKKEQQRRAAEVYDIEGAPATVGSFLAREVAEPGTTPFRLVEGVANLAVAFTDPGALALTAAGRAARARKVFVAAGGIEGRRKTVLGSFTEEWMGSKQGNAVVSKLAEIDDPVEIRRLSNNAIPAVALSDLAAANTPELVKGVLRRHLGADIPEQFKLGGYRVEVKSRVQGVRLLQWMPNPHVSPDDLDGLVENVERLGRTATLPEETTNVYLRRMINATDSRIERFRIFEDMADEIATHMLGPNATDDARRAAKQITRLYKDTTAGAGIYFVDEIGNNVPIGSLMIEGTEQALPSAHYFSEYIKSAIPMPDVRALRRATSTIGRLANTPGFDVPIGMLEFMTQDVWKPMVLIRPAWAVRQVAESQARMAFSGLSSPFNHLIDYIAYVTGRKGGAGRAGLPTDLNDLQEWKESLEGGARWRERRVRFGQRLVGKNDPEFPRDWGDEIAKSATDPVAQRVVGGWQPGDRVPGGLTGNDVEDAKRWFFEGPGKKFRLDMAEARGREFMNIKTRADGTSYAGDVAAGRKPVIRSADDYIESIQHRISIKTGDDSELLEAVRLQFYRGKPLSVKDKKGHAAMNPDFVDALRTKMDVAPPVVAGTKAIILGGRWTERADAFVDTLMTAFGSLPENVAARAPAWKQFYWQAIEQRVGFMDEAMRRKVLGWGDEWGLSRSEKAALKQRMDELPPGDLLTDEDTIKALAAGQAKDNTKKLFYQAHERRHISDVLRITMPFAHAWADILATWARIGVQSRGAPIVYGARVVDRARQSGWFMTDPDTGQEVFAWPGSEWVMAMVPGGAPVPFTSSVRGLNLVGASVIPGLGPVGQIAVDKLIPNKPDWQFVREQLLPYGPPDNPLSLTGHVPSWARKIAKWWADPDSDRDFGNAVKDAMTYLVSTGEYSTDTPDEIDRLEARAVELGRAMFVVRGLLQTTLPSPPKPNVPVETDVGRIAAGKIRDELEEWRKQDRENNEQTASVKLLTKYGPNAFLLLQGKTVSSIPGMPYSKEALAWIRTHSDQVRRHERVYQFFAPRKGEFDYAAYARSLETGEREALRPRDFVKAANAMMARMVYEEQRARLGGRKDRKAQDWLRQVREQLIEEFPGFGEALPVRQREETKPLIRQLQAALDDPKLAETDAGKGLSIYLEARERALQAAKQRGYQSLGGTKVADLAMWMREVATLVEERHPDFADMFDLVFDRELAEEP